MESTSQGSIGQSNEREARTNKASSGDSFIWRCILVCAAGKRSGQCPPTPHCVTGT
jgi:hypothetical protein